MQLQGRLLLSSACFPGLQSRGSAEPSQAPATLFGNEEGVHGLCRIGYKMFEFVVDGVEGKHHIFADVGTSGGA